MDINSIRFNSIQCLQDTRNLAQLPPPDPRFDTRMQAEQRGGVGGADSHLRGGADGAYYPGQQGLGGQVNMSREAGGLDSDTGFLFVLSGRCVVYLAVSSFIAV